MRQPEGKKIIVCLGFLFLGIFLLLQTSPVLNPVTYDESNLVYDGARLTQGEMPYRDFFNFVPPVTFYLMAGAHSLLPNLPETAERDLVIVFVFLTTIAWFFTLRRLGWSELESLAATALFPVCLYPFSPFAPHHWFAFAWFMLTMVSSLYLLKRHEARQSWFLPGLAAGLALCTLQTVGFFAWVFLAAVLLRNGGRIKTILLRGLWSALGWTAGIMLCLGPLILQGAGPSIRRDLVTWPLSNYHRVGNLNDVGFLVGLPGRLARLWIFSGRGNFAVDIVGAVSGTILYAAVLLLGLLCLAAVGWTIKRFMKGRHLDPGAASATLLTVLIFGVFIYSNSTWVHLVYGLPAVFFLWLCVFSSVRARLLRRKWFKVAVLVFLAAGLLYRGSLLAMNPPAVWQLTDVDRVDRDSLLDRSLRKWPYLKSGDRIVVIPTGGNVYLYTYPAAIGYTYFFPLQDRYNNMEDHEIVARQIRRNRPEAILIHKIRYKDFLVPEDPVARVLKTRYHKVEGTPVIVAMVRNDGADNRRGPAHSRRAESDKGGVKRGR